MANKKIRPALEEFEPTPDLLLCEQLLESETTGSGIIVIPESVRVPLTQGVVLKCGENCDKERYKPGRVIVFRMHTEDRVKIGTDSYIVVDPTNVILTGPISEE